MSGSREVSLVGGWLAGYGWSARPVALNRPGLLLPEPARVRRASSDSPPPAPPRRAAGGRPSPRSTACAGTAAAWSGRTGRAAPAGACGSRARSGRAAASSPIRIVSRAVAGRLQRAPGLPDQAAVHAGRHRHRRAVDRLRPQVLAEVRLVPDRPEAHPRQRSGLSRAARRCRCSALRPRGRTARSPGPKAARPSNMLSSAASGMPGPSAHRGAPPLSVKSTAIPSALACLTIAS